MTDYQDMLTSHLIDIRQDLPEAKIGFNKGYGYFVALSQARTSDVPKSWSRKQTLRNEERWASPLLIEINSQHGYTR